MRFSRLRWEAGHLELLMGWEVGKTAESILQVFNFIPHSHTQTAHIRSIYIFTSVQHLELQGSAALQKISFAVLKILDHKLSLCMACLTVYSNSSNSSEILTVA